MTTPNKLTSARSGKKSVYLEVLKIETKCAKNIKIIRIIKKILIDVNFIITFPFKPNLLQQNCIDSSTRNTTKSALSLRINALVNYTVSFSPLIKWT